MEARENTKRSDTRDPRRSRLAALRVLYEADIRGEDIDEALGRYAAASATGARAPRSADLDEDHGVIILDGFAVTLIRGVAEHLSDIDAQLARLSRGWRLERMPALDRNALRLAVRELQSEATPVAVVIDEAVRLVGELSTVDSGRFVNGILAAVVKELPGGPAEGS
jgi:transcription antitermination protein NusB